jgi:uncharacterized small protein (DUF1192 family)
MRRAGAHFRVAPAIMLSFRFYTFSARPDHTRAFWQKVWENIMSNGSSLSLAELEERIAAARDNIRQLIEQAAAYSGAEDEDRNADRLARQNEDLERLIKQRDALLKK